MATKKRSAASKKAMKALEGVSKTAKELGVTKPKARGKVVTGKRKKKK
jgi:hypothetical protein